MKKKKIHSQLILHLENLEEEKLLKLLKKRMTKMKMKHSSGLTMTTMKRKSKSKKRNLRNERLVADLPLRMHQRGAKLEDVRKLRIEEFLNRLTQRVN